MECDESECDRGRWNCKELVGSDSACGLWCLVEVEWICGVDQLDTALGIPTMTLSNLDRHSTFSHRVTHQKHF